MPALRVVWCEALCACGEASAVAGSLNGVGECAAGEADHALAFEAAYLGPPDSQRMTDLPRRGDARARHGLTRFVALTRRTTALLGQRTVRCLLVWGDFGELRLAPAGLCGLACDAAALIG